MRAPLRTAELREWPLSDGYRARGRWWPPTGTARQTAILYLHGIQSHGGWYEWSAALLAAAGHAVALPDRRGSGMNAAARGDAASVEQWLDDLDVIADWMERETGAARIAVVGVSWGGKLAVAWAQRHGERVARILLIAPGLFPQVGVGFAERVRIGVALLSGDERTFAIPLDDPSLFTSNPMGQQFVANDPLKLTCATGRFLYNSARLDRRLARLPRAALITRTTLLLAGRDRIIRNDATARWLRKIAGEAPNVQTLADSDHTIEFDREIGPFERVVSAWRDELP